MTIGTSILLIAVGAILKWAVTAHVSGINLQTAGTVLFVLGIIGLIISAALHVRVGPTEPDHHDPYLRPARRAADALPVAR